MQHHKKKAQLHPQFWLKLKKKHKTHFCHQVFDPPLLLLQVFFLRLLILLRPAVFMQLLLLLLLQQPHLKKGKSAIWTGRQPASRLLLFEMQPAHGGASELKRLEFGLFQDVQVETSS